MIDGHTLVESLPIIEYLDETFPDKPKLLPSDPFKRWQARVLAETVNSGTQPLQNLSVLNKLEGFGVDKAEWAADYIEKGLAVFETHASKSSGIYSVGDEVTIADVCLIPQLYNANRFKVSLENFPTILKIQNNLEKLDAFIKAHPDN